MLGKINYEDYKNYDDYAADLWEAICESTEQGKIENPNKNNLASLVMYYFMWCVKENETIKTTDELYDRFQNKINNGEWKFPIMPLDDFEHFFREKSDRWEKLLKIVGEYSSEELKDIILNIDLSDDAPIGIDRLAEELLEINEQDSILVLNSSCDEFALEVKKRHPQVNIEAISSYGDHTVAAIKADVLGIENLIFNDDDENDVFNKSYVGTRIDANMYIGTQPQDVMGCFEYEGIDIPVELSGEWPLCVYGIIMMDTLAKSVAVMNPADITLKQAEDSRKFICQNGYVEGVILLPNKVYANTWINPYLVVFSQNNDKVRFLNAQAFCTQERRRNKIMNVISEQAALEIAQAYHDDAKTLTVSLEEIAKNGYNLNPLRYILPEKQDENFVKLSECIKKIKRGVSLKAAVMDEFISEEKSNMKCVRIPQLASGVIDDSMYFHGEINKPEKNMAHKGDILLSKVGAPFKVAVANDDYLIIGNIYIISINHEKITPEYLKCFLCSSQGQKEINRLSAGAATPNLSVEEIGNIRIPIFEKEKQALFEQETYEIEKLLQESLQTVRECKKKLNMLFD